MIPESGDHPEVAEYVGGELPLDALGCLLASAGRDRGIVHEHLDPAAPALGEGRDGHSPTEVGELEADDRGR